MKVRKLWLPALILGCIGAAALILDTIYNVGGSGFVLNSQLCAAVFVCSLLLLIIIGFAMSIGSRKYEIKSSTPGRSILAGVFGFIASVSIIGSAVLGLLSFGKTESTLIAGIFTGISILIYMFGGVVLLYEACISFTGHNGMVKRPLLSLGPVLWATGRLIIMFLNYQRISLHAAVKYDVISTALLVMFLYYQAMYISQPEKAVAVRRTTLYGIIYIACAAAVCGDIITKMIMPMISSGYSDTVVIEPTFSRILSISADISLALYAVFFIHSMHKNTELNEIEEEEEEDVDTRFLGSLSTSSEEDKPEADSGEKNETAAEEIKDEPAAEAPAEPEKEPEPVAAAPVEPEKEPEPVAEAPAEPEKEPEPVAEAPAEPEKEPEPVAEVSAEPEKEPEPVAAAPVELEKEPEPVAEAPAEPEKKPEPVAEAPAEPEKKPEPVFTKAPAPSKTSDLIDEMKKRAAEDEQKELEEMFANSEDDYDEIFRILDEMSDE